MNVTHWTVVLPLSLLLAACGGETKGAQSQEKQDKGLEAGLRRVAGQVKKLAELPVAGPKGQRKEVEGTADVIKRITPELERMVHRLGEMADIAANPEILHAVIPPGSVVGYDASPPEFCTGQWSGTTGPPTEWMKRGTGNQVYQLPMEAVIGQPEGGLPAKWDPVSLSDDPPWYVSPATNQCVFKGMMVHWVSGQTPSWDLSATNPVGYVKRLN